MAHTHPVVDSDPRFVINSITRAISTTSDKLELIQGDHQSERITFEIPKIVEGHDMSLSDRIEVHYINIDRKTNATSRDVYIIDDAVVDGDKLTFSWLISSNATKYYGRLNFIILFECLDPDGNYTYKWNTEICKLLTVGEGISNTSAVIEDHSDILEKFKKEFLEYVDSKQDMLIQSGASVGQIAKITAVDSSGKPTAWEAVDMPSGGGSTVELDATLTQSGKAADAAVVGNRLSALSGEIAAGVSWNELKDKPFYLEKTLVVELTKDDFTVNDQDGYIKYMYRSTPKLDWFVSAESIAFEIEIIDTNGRRYTATQDSIDVRFEKNYTDDDYEYWSCYSELFEIVSGVDLDFYDDEYYYKDEWGVLVKYGGIEFSGINIKIYRVDVKKIPEICLDAAIGKTAITVGSGKLEDSETEMSPSVIVPDLIIPVNPTNFNEEIYYNRMTGKLRTSGDLFPYSGKVRYNFPYPTPTTAGASISFDISSEGDTLWDSVGHYSPWSNGGYLLFELVSTYSGGGIIRFLSNGNGISNLNGAVAASNLGRLYTVVFEYINNYKTLNVTLKCVAE